MVVVDTAGHRNGCSTRLAQPCGQTSECPHAAPLVTSYRVTIELRRHPPMHFFQVEIRL